MIQQSQKLVKFLQVEILLYLNSQRKQWWESFQAQILNFA
jgi:hypothetical protein